MQVKVLQLKSALRAALLVLLLCAGTRSYAERVEPEVARAVAATFLNNNGVRSNQLTDLSERAGFPNLYIFNGESGFVVMAADDCTKPILGYSLTGQFLTENMPENLRWWLQGYNDQIQYAIDNQLRNSSDAAQEWEELRNGRPNVGQRAVVVGPLISTEWGQDNPYNLQCPIGCPTGCVATAMAQIMKKWNYPAQGQGSHTNLNNSNQTVNFGETMYQWNKMINSYANEAGTEEQKEAVATLMYHCGVSVDMAYGTNASSAYDNAVPYALNDYFKYSNEAYYDERDLVGNDDVWKSIMKGELDAGRPMLYGGGVGDEGHAFVCDGYASGNYFHFNWGWDGEDQNAYYSLDALQPNSSFNLSNHQDAVFGIYPSNIGHPAPTNFAISISGRTANLSWDTVSGVSSYRIYRNGELIAANVTDSSYSDNSLEIGVYQYYIRSNWSDGRFSAPSEIMGFEIEYAGNVNATIGNLRYSLNEQTLTAEVIGRKSGFNSGDLVIPSEVEYTNQYHQTHTYTVVSIGDRAFYHCSGFFGDLIISNTIVSIGDYAFDGCHGFTGNLTIPSSVNHIGNYAFRYCNGFSTVHYNIPNQVELGYGPPFVGCGGNLVLGGNVVCIPGHIFSDGAFTGGLSIPNSVTTIGEYAFSGCSGFTGILVVPNTVVSLGNAFFGCTFSGLEIDMTNIPDYAFNGCEGFTGSLTIGNSVTTIGNCAFSGCIGFTGSLIIPSSVISIGSSTFSNCSGFTGSLVIPNSVISIGSSAFSSCTGFTGSLVIPNSVISIGSSAFSNCSYEELIINMTDIPQFAFRYCSGMTLTIGNTVNSIGDNAFFGCSFSNLNIDMANIPDNALTHWGYTGFTGNLVIGNSVTTIGTRSFSGCSGFTGTLVIPNCVTTLSSSSFSGCCFSGLEINMTNIPNYAFEDNTCFTGNLTIGDSVTTIGYGAFRGCNGFDGILTIPNSVTTIAIEAFEGCSGFAEVLFNAENCEIQYTYSNYDYPFQGCGGVLVIGENVGRIPDYMFRNASFTGDLVIPSSVTEIGYSAFSHSGVYSGCLIIGNSITTIGDWAFSGCSFNGSLTIPSSLTTIGSGVFYGSAFTGSVTIPNTVITMEDNAFHECSCDGLYVDMIIIPDNCFYQCDDFTGNLTIGNSVTMVGDEAFCYCSGFSGILSIGNSVTSIGEGAFYGCSGFTGDLDIPNSVSVVGREAFRNCYGFTGILNIPNSVTSLEALAFANCRGFTGTLFIPNSLTLLSNSVFGGCSGFTSLVIPNSVTTIGNDAFGDCSGLTSLTIPNSVTSIGNYAFQGCSGLSTITVLAEMPPTLGFHVFHNLDTSIIPVYVPCGSISDYQSSAGWNIFANYQPATTCASGEITVTVNPTEGGTVTGTGYHEGGTLCTLTATPNEGYLFLNWSKNGEVVSFDSTYSFMVVGDADFVANFAEEGDVCFITFDLYDSYGDGYTGNYLVVTDENGSQQLTIESGSSASYILPFLTGSHITLTWIVGSYPGECSFTMSYSNGNVIYQGSNVNNNFNYEFDVDCNVASIENIVFVDPNVKAICVANWDTNGDGELSYDEAAVVTDLGYVFRNNATITSFEELQYFTGLTTIGNYAFYYCYGLTSLTIPNSVTTIGNYAFYYCYGLTSLTIPNSVTTIVYAAFAGCSGLEQIIVDEDNLSYDSRENSNAIIETSTNTLITGCKNTIIPNSVTSIGYAAFESCSGLTSLTIPNSVTSIGGYAFYGCSGLSTISVLAETPPTLGYGVFYNIDTSLPVYVPCSSIPNYQSSADWNEFTNYQPATTCASGEITVTVNPAEGGTVTGTGYYEGGTICTLLATPNEGYLFLNWSKNGEVVSTDSTYSFIVAGDAEYVSNFAEEGDVCFITFDLYDSYGDGYTGNYLVVTDENGLQRLTVESGSTAVYTLPFLTGSHITLTWIVGSYPGDCSFTMSYEDGTSIYEGTNLSSSFFYEFDVNCNTSYTISKTIVGYGEGTGNWYLIASPVSQTLSPDEVANMIDSENANYYDLYRFDQNEAGAEWQNYKAQQNDFSIVNGQGYLYANKNDVTLSFVGTPLATSSLSVDLDYTENKPFAGWNLIGNPFNDEATLDLPFYRMASGGEALEPTTETGIIAPMEGVFVKATASGQTAVFTIEENNRLTIPSLNIGVLCNRGEVVNKAIVRFDNGGALEKFSFGEQSGTIYIPQDGKDYIVASTGKVGEIPVSFKAETNGSYTLSFTNEEVTFSYLRLIDNMTGVETDLLETPYYTFNAQTTDYASRFRLVFATGSSIDGDSFGFLNSSGTLTIYGIDGEATLQVVDMLGHILNSERFSGNYEKKLNVAPGVYMLRLINGDDVKVQKIVVR